MLNGIKESIKEGINSVIDERIAKIKYIIYDSIIENGGFDNVCLIAFMTCLTLNIMDVPGAKKCAGMVMAFYIMIKFLVVVFI